MEFEITGGRLTFTPDAEPTAVVRHTLKSTWDRPITMVGGLAETKGRVIGVQCVCGASWQEYVHKEQIDVNAQVRKWVQEDMFQHLAGHVIEKEWRRG